MNAKYWLSPAVEQSLDDIFDYTYDRWGEDQARRYLSALFDLFEAIASGREIGRLIQAEYGVVGFYARCGKHAVYWKRLPDGRVAIAEILHEKMNAGDRLAASSELNRPDED